MAEFWTETHLRGQQTIAVWSRFAPTFTVGSLTLAAFTADVAQILTLVNLRDVQQDALDMSIAARDRNFDLIHQANIRIPPIIAANLEDDDDLKDEVADVTAVDPDTQDGNQERARRLVSLWKRVDANRAALSPPLPAIVRGTSNVSTLEAALIHHPQLLQNVEHERVKLNELKSRFRTLERRVDRASKKWYAAWSNAHDEGTPERDALTQVDTEQGLGAPTPLEIEAVTLDGSSVRVTYAEGGGRRATTLELLHQVVGTDPDFDHPVAAILSGQSIGPFPPGATVRVQTRATNSRGTAQGDVRTITRT